MSTRFDRVQLAEDQAVAVLLGLAAHDRVLAEDDLVAVAELLVPGQAELVRRQAGDHVVVAVAIDVVGVHLGAAGPANVAL